MWESSIVNPEGTFGLRTSIPLLLAGMLGLLWACTAFSAEGSRSRPATRLDGTKDVYVDLRDAASSSCGWGTARNGASVTGAELRIGSVTFEHGVGTHAPAEIVYRVGGKYRWLAFYTGISEEMTENGSVTAQIWLDGKKAAETPVMGVKEEPRYVCLPIAGVQEVRLVGTDAGNGVAADHVCFGNLRLSVAKDEPKPDAPKPQAPTTIQPLKDLREVMPAHGSASIEAAKKWEFAFVTGNGRMGAMVFGHPTGETIVANHCRLFLPLGSREIVPDLGKHLPEIRRLIRQKGYGEAFRFMEAKAREQGWRGLVWTDPFHPGFELKLHMAAKGPVTDYVRTEDFRTGEVTVRWRDESGAFRRRLFVSRTDNAIVLSISGPGPGKLDCTLAMAAIRHTLIDAKATTDSAGITLHCVYVKGKGGYDGCVRVVPRGGKAESDGNDIRVTGADEILVLMRLTPWTKAEQSDPPALRQALAKLPADYERLLAPHAKAHGEILNRVTLDLGGGADRGLSSEELLDRAAKERKPSGALLEKMYDAGRYMLLCSGGELAPNLQGIWTGTWSPAWSGDFTLDTNIQAAIGSGLSTDMPECMEGYFRLVESFLPDCRLNAKRIYGCRGVLTNSRASNNCLLLHWGSGWPGQFWTAGAGWLAHWFYDHYLYTGDEEFLAKRTVPLLKEIALFYEDFLFLDDSGRYRFSPSFSPETELGDNATMDIAVAKEVLANLIAACEELKIEAAGVARWKAMLDKMPPYRINEAGELSEWGLPGHNEHYGHRHHSFLYPVFQSRELTPEKTPQLWQAAKAALLKKIRSNGEQSSFGRMQAGLSAAYLGMGEEAYGRLAIMAVRKSMYPSLITSHEPGQGIFNTDGNGSIPELVNCMLVCSWPGKLDLLPALPKAWPRGSISGILARGQIRIDRLAWDKSAKEPAGTLELALTSAIAQTVTLRLPNGSLGRRSIQSLRVVEGPADVKDSPAGANSREVRLPAGKSVRLMIAFEDRIAPGPTTGPAKKAAGKKDR